MEGDVPRNDRRKGGKGRITLITYCHKTLTSSLNLFIVGFSKVFGNVETGCTILFVIAQTTGNGQGAGATVVPT